MADRLPSSTTTSTEFPISWFSNIFTIGLFGVTGSPVNDSAATGMTRGGKDRLRCGNLSARTAQIPCFSATASDGKMAKWNA